MRELYTEIEPAESGLLPVGSGHEIYFEDCGARTGLPVIFLHGGPGSGAKPHHRQYFNPDRYRIVVFDQRGSGRCQPHGRLEGNTTRALLGDMESIRERLGIDRWVVFGGSWGATLALLYAEQYPESTAALVLRGTFLARSQDLHWMLGHGANRFFPEFWDEFTKDFQAREPEALLQEMAQKVFSDDADKQYKSARAWALWTGRVVTHTLVNHYELETGDTPRKLIDTARLEMHYASQRYFIRENQILEDIGQVPEVPVKIIHGRHDMVCTPSASWAVHKALPKSEMTLLPAAGHLAGEPAMVDALIRATDDIAAQLGTGPA